MGISSIGNRPEQAVLQLKQKGDRGKSGDPLEIKEKLTSNGTGVTGLAQEGQQGKGVVGLLQEGHFRGVADVRLRINFHEQLQLVANEKSGEVANMASRELIVELEGKVQSFGQEYQVRDQVGGLLSGFREETVDLLGDTQGGSDASSVIAGLREAFASMLSSLHAIFAAGEPKGEMGEAVEEAVAGDGEILREASDASAAMETGPPSVPEEPDTWSTALQKLQEWFETEITALEKRVNDLHTLPDPVSPNGNGVAYSRFMEMYEQLEAGTAFRRSQGKA